MGTVTNLNEKTSKELQRLARLNQDAAQGYETAASDVDDEGIVGVFNAASHDRRRMADELCEAMGLSMDQIPDEGTTAGWAHRWWIDLRSKLNRGNPRVLLIEATRGENALIEAYEDVSLDDDAAPLKPMLQQHIQTIRETRNRLEALQIEHK